MITDQEAVTEEELQKIVRDTHRNLDSRNVIVESRAYDRDGRLVLGPVGAAHALKVLHHAAAGHMGVKKLLAKFRERYTAPGDQKLAEEIVCNCHGCLVGLDYRHKPVRAGRILGNFPWHTLAVDSMGPFPLSEGKWFVVTFQDAFSGYNILVTSADYTADAVAKLLIERVVAYFGVPVRILSDRGRELISHVWDQLEVIQGCTMF